VQGPKSVDWVSIRWAVEKKNGKSRDGPAKTRGARKSVKKSTRILRALGRGHFTTKRGSRNPGFGGKMAKSKRVGKKGEAPKDLRGWCPVIRNKKKKKVAGDQGKEIDERGWAKAGMQAQKKRRKKRRGVQRKQRGGKK